MQEAKKALLFASVISLISDVLIGKEIDYGELIDSLEILGLDSDYVLNLHPIQAFHHICKSFTEMNVTSEMIEHIKSGEIVE